MEEEQRKKDVSMTLDPVLGLGEVGGIILVEAGGLGWHDERDLWLPF